MKTLLISLSDAKRIRDLEKAQRTFRQNKDATILTEEQRKKVGAGIVKVKGILKKEKVHRKSILAKLRAIRAEIKQVREEKADGWRQLMVKLKRKANKTSMYWYGRPMYKSVLPKESITK